MKKRHYKVRYARLVIMETVVEAVPKKGSPNEPAKFLDDGRLPGVFHGISDKKIGSHIKDIQDYEQIWEVKPMEAA